MARLPEMPLPQLPGGARDLATLTLALVDIPSVSDDERHLADLVGDYLSGFDHLDVTRDGDTVVARTSLGRAERVIVAGHLDTVPIAGNVPGRLEPGPSGERVWGRGAVDMKGGLAVMLAAAGALTDPVRDVTWVFYDHEEVASERSGLGRVVRDHPDWLAGDFAVLCEPTSGGIEGGCNGTLRFQLRFHGTAAHSARAWMGHNAIHDAAGALRQLAAYDDRFVPVDGLVYREALNAVAIEGGIAANVIPDLCVLTINYRFAPDRSAVAAQREMEEMFLGIELVVTDAADGARPGLDAPAAAEFVAAARALGGGDPVAKLGWTDVARFTALGIPAVNFGPGDATLAHRDDEACEVAQIDACYATLTAWLAGAAVAARA